MMKKFKDGKLFDVPEKEAEKVREKFKRHAPKNRKEKDSEEYEAKIKKLEDSLAEVLAKLNEKTEEVESTEVES